MILIDEILISDDVIEEQFACNLSSCKGACCYEGDYGAPLEVDEIETIRQYMSMIEKYLDQASIDRIKAKDFFEWVEDGQTYATQLMKDGACVFMGRNEIGITFCGIEKAYNEGLIDFKKPISCHLYPIRINENTDSGFTALNYDRWDICSSACQNGKAKKIRIYEFVKDALIRKFGEGFYDQLEMAVEDNS